MHTISWAWRTLGRWPAPPRSPHGCLKPGELYVDNLARDTVMPHVRVASSDCVPGSFTS